MSESTQSKPNAPRYWFHAKRYGWGWGLPATWEGWLVAAMWMAVVITFSPWLAVWDPIAFIVFIVVMTGLLITICYAKGEPPRWRWGDRKSNDI